jgi:hypothetical protein
MSAIKPTSPTTRQRLTSIRFLIVAIATAIASAFAFFGVSANFATQDASTPSASTPAAAELQERRQQAIDDGADQLELEFQELNDSGVEGTVTLYAIGEQTLVAIDIEGGGESHPAHIHAGTCDDLDPEPFVPLATVDDSGESLTLISTPLTGLLDDPFAIDLHLSPDELGTLIVCADIEGEPSPATPAPADTATPSPTEGAVNLTTAVATVEAAANETPTPTQESTAVPTQTPTIVPEQGAIAAPESSQDGTGGAQAAPDTVASLPLMDYSELGVTGTVTLVSLDESTTKVTIRLTGDAVTGGHIAHLHPGTCESPEDEGTIYLENLDEAGVSDSTVNVSISGLLDSGWAVNVHNSDIDYDTWLVCGELQNATVGMSGVAAVTPESQDDVAAPIPTAVVISSDGTSGIGASGDRTTSTLTQGVGVGSGLAWPESETQNIVWAMTAFALVLLSAGLMLRRSERVQRQPTRWNRLGI